jgi:serine/threonine protein kinase
VAEFLEMLELVEEEATAPTAAVEAPPAVEGDLLEAKVGEVISEWEIVRRLGTGSTARAWLATNRLTNAAEVLKVALSDEKIPRLEHEARVLSRLGDSRVIRLAREEPIRIGNGTAIVLAHAGETTVARKLREDGRLTVDELETYSDYLFGVVDYLEGEGVAHRDIKPDNIAIRIRPNRTRQLVLFDFSLAGISVEDIEAGTPRYLDPFLGMATRPIYDEAAERYAVAVTLHEMASGELPAWGDGRTEPRMTEGPPVLAVEAFDPAIRDGLVAFFLRALDRDVRRRHRSLKEMRDSWLQVFLSSDSTAPVGSVHPDDESAETTAEERDAAATRANRATLLEASGLTLRAVSAAHRLEAVTVKDLLGLGSKQLLSLPGLGAKTRQELQGRIKEWRTRLGEDERPTPRTEAAAEIAAAEAAVDSTEPELSRIGLDTIAAILVPKLQANGRNRVEVEGTRLLLGLPNEAGVLPDLQPWPQQPPVAAALGVTSARITQVMSAQRRRWRDEPVVRSLSHEILDLLAESGRVMGTTELAEALLMRRGSAQTGDLRRRAVAMAAVRAAVEIDGLEEERRLLVRRHGDRLMVALEVTPDDGSDTPAAPALLDYADTLGRVADRLATQEVLPGPATVLRELGTVAAKADQTGISLDDRRMVQLAAVASDNAAATPRLEIYPRDLDPVRALRLAQAGVVPAPVGMAESIGLAPRQVQERVRARFPELADLPGHPHLDRLLAEAGFDLRWRRGRYHPRHVAASASMSTSLRRRSTDSRATVWTADSPELAAALRAEQRLVSAAADGGFRALTVSVRDCLLARAELVRRFDVRPLDVAAAFVAQLRALVAERPKLRWQTVLGADAPHSPDAVRLRPLVDEAWRRTGPDLRAALTGSTPLLLHDAAPLARYGAMPVLYGLADAARGGVSALWLLCPMEDPGHLPRLDGTVVEIPPADEWISLPEAWVTNRHRSGDIAS